MKRATGITSADDPTQTGTISTCNLWYDVASGDTCSSVEEAFGITSEQFIAWNPAVSSDCTTNFWVGDSYCVGISTVSTSSTSTTTTSSASKTAETAANEPTQSGQAFNCDSWYDVVSGDTCSSIETAFGITSAQFIAWNPTISSDCSSGLLYGYSYCVGINANATSTSSALIKSTTTSQIATYSILAASSHVVSSWPTATGSPPTPTQTGILSTCLRYYQAQDGDTCQIIVNRYSHLIDMDDFLDWNPAVGTNCTSLYIAYYYCIDAPLTMDNSTATTQLLIAGWTAAALPTMNSTFAPSPTASGLISSCQSYYEADEDDTCDSVISSLGYLDVNEFEDWNTGINCSTSLTDGTYYCVANYTNNPLPSTVSVLPSPVQTGIVSTCTGWYLADSDDTCEEIAEIFGTFSEDDFLSWNPAVGSGCSNITAGDYYCVAVPGTPTTATTTATTATYSTNGVGPQPEQTGISDDCASYWLVGVDDTCEIIEEENSITEDQFLDWNPALGSDCSSLLENYYVCVLMPNATTTGGNLTLSADNSTTSASSSFTASSTITTASSPSLSTPTPYQSGMVSGCERFYLVESNNDCYDIALEANIALTDFYTWNPAVGSDCSDLESGEYVCLGTTGPLTTITSGTPIPATPSPTQTGMVSGCLRFYYVESGDGCYDIALDAGISLDDFYSWNPAVSDCADLEASVFVCIGISGQATTITSGTPVAATGTATATSS
ncbi:carbohydrate-binding module family 50 protein [Penicillium verhagenii]|nr:carbohydrate-binding module family 50 protein [Penicillium verhagenii]